MTTMDLARNHSELLKWISERNAHIPQADLEFLIGISPVDVQPVLTSNERQSCEAVI
ncbi:hypothetical protein [Mariprofundus erugo]|uniref:hypothetical protein n=1 Tax=Mariprofundus erugo TaxID=2528639 RepID=UPI001375E6B1|nr:hypothetical protein [Mariprofundus erugo]